MNREKFYAERKIGKMGYILLLCMLLHPVPSYATVSFLCVNHITKELYWFEDMYIGIGWEGLGEGDARLQRLETEFLEKGYHYTIFPYKIELCIGLFIVFFVVFAAIVSRRLWRRLIKSFLCI